ncbi:MAG: proliferating cell nuclear antigen (pcna) [Pontimonas sp.]
MSNNAVPNVAECDVYVRTLQGAVVRQLIEVLKDVIFEASLIITPSMMKITTMDSSKSSLIYLKLESTSFEEYQCRRDMRLGLSMINLFKIIKTAGHKNDIVTLFVKKDTPYELGVVIENEEKRSRTVFALALLELDSQDIQIPEFQYQSIVTLPSAMFHRMSRDMQQLANYVTIETYNGSLTLSCSGDFAKQATTFSPLDGDENVIVQTNDQDRIRGTFSLKFLCLFGRTASLSSMVSIFIKQDHPLLLEYTIGSLGKLIFLLTPVVDDD